MITDIIKSFAEKQVVKNPYAIEGESAFDIEATKRSDFENATLIIGEFCIKIVLR